MALKHPCREHPLIPRTLSNYSEVLCGLCNLEIHGRAYCCNDDDCDYFLHEACAAIELPREIWHPSHRHHPLTLSSDPGHNYSCGTCSGFTLHALTAIATLSPRESEQLNEHTVEEHEHNQDVHEEKRGTIWHFAHKEHPLASFFVEIQVPTECKGCARRISGEVYGCRACLFLLHASCARAPPVIDRHPFGTGLTLAQYDRNPTEAHVPDTCKGCAESIDNGFLYTLPGGPSASLRLHMACAISTKFPPDGALADSMDLKLHPSHPCPLVPLYIEEDTYAPIRCRACELQISGELAVGCPKCAWFLHKSCTEKLREEIHHYLHPDHSLKLREPPTQRDKNYRCASCRVSLSENDVYNMAFRCEGCDFHLHHSCALQTLSAVKEGVAASVLHFAHDHPLQLHFIRYNDNSHDEYACCTACKQRIVGLAYCCQTCDSVRLHKSCAELPQQLAHEFHSHHLLAIPSGRYFRCSACHEKSTGSGYCCAKCDFYLDVGCASQNPTVKNPLHDHKLAYFKERPNGHLPCSSCGKTCKKDLYLCVPCEFRIHHGCSFPPMVKHEGHGHLLHLIDSFVDGDPDYQYCDHCEELRDPDQVVYCCDRCEFKAHIDCILPTAKVHIEEEVEETEVEVETEVDPKEMETSNNKVGDLINSILANIMARTVVMGRNIDETRKSLEKSMEKLEELEKERQNERKESALLLKARE